MEYFSCVCEETANKVKCGPGCIKRLWPANPDLACEAHTHIHIHTYIATVKDLHTYLYSYPVSICARGPPFLMLLLFPSAHPKAGYETLPKAIPDP